MHKNLLLITFLMVAVATIGFGSTVLAAGEGVIAGQVVNKTQGGSLTGVLEVTLTTYVNDKVASEQKVTTDSAGKFEFKGLSIDPSNTYFVKTGFQDAEYSSGKINFKADSPSQTVELAVYDSTISDENMQISNGHMVVFVDQGELQVMEVWKFINMGVKTYIGTRGKTARATLKFTLPQGASSVSPGEGFAPETADNGIVDTSAIPPGVTTVSFSYIIPYQGSDITISRKTDYAVASFGLLVQDSGVKVKSVALTPKDPLDMGGTKYLYFTAQNLSRGTDLDASFAGVSRPSVAVSGSSSPWPWLAAGAAVLGLIVTVAYPRLRKKQALAHSPYDDMQSLSVAQTPNEENALIRELASLDDDHEAGRIKDAEYRTRRARTKARLLGIYSYVREGDKQ